MAAPGVYMKVLKDDFNRPNEEPAAGWTDYEAAGLRIVSNALTQGVGGGGAFWAADPVLGNAEIYFTAAAASSGDSYPEWRKNQAAGTGYGIFANGGDVNRFDLAVVNIGNIGGHLAAGEEICIQHIGSALEIFRRISGGSWFSAMTATDGTYESGRFQIAMYGTLTLDSFSLGTYLPSDTPRPPAGRGATW